MRLLAIDPGVTNLGAAIFDMGTKRLLEAKCFKGLGFRHEMWGVLELAQGVAAWAAGSDRDHFGAVAMEWPQVYAGRQRGKKDPNDLLPLAAVNGMILALLSDAVGVGADCTLYKPHDWKGSKKANPTARWILSRLDAVEKKQIEDVVAFEDALRRADEAGEEVGHKTHNTIDAVGVGLKFLGRLNKERVIHR